MRSLRVDHLECTYTDAWVLTKYDDSPAHQHIKKLQSTKGVDLIGVHKGTRWFIELKDYASQLPEEPRVVPSDLPAIFGLKIRDTLAGVIGEARRTKTHTVFSQALCNVAHPINALLLVDLNGPPPKANTMRDVLQNKCKRQLGWLHARCAVAGYQAQPLPDITLRRVRDP